MKTCRCCSQPICIADCSNQRAWVLAFLYGIMAEHACGSTVALVIWEVPDEVLIQDDEAYAINHERDTRAA